MRGTSAKKCLTHPESHLKYQTGYKNTVELKIDQLWNGPLKVIWVSRHSKYYSPCPKLGVHFPFWNKINIPKMVIGNKVYKTIDCDKIIAFFNNVKVKHGLLVRDRESISLSYDIMNSVLKLLLTTWRWYAFQKL